MAEKKLAVIVASLAGGGVEQMMIHLVESINESSNFEAELVVISDLPPNVSQHHLPAGWHSAHFLHKERVLQGFHSLFKLIRLQQYDVVISAQEHVNLLVSWVLKLIRTPIVFIPVVHNTLSIKLGKSQKWKDHVLIPLCRFFYPRFQAIGAVSQGVKEDLVQFLGVPANHIHILPNPVLKLQNAGEIDKADEKPGKADFGGILAMGRLVPEKGFDVLLRAYAQVAQEVAVPLIIVGEGPERESLVKLIKELGLEDTVSLPGFIESPWQHFQQAKLFVLSSREEGLPTVLIEALAQGIPVISTDCPSGPREILQDGKVGRLVPVDNVEALAQAIRETLNQTTFSSKYSIQSAMRYSYRNSREAYLDMISKLEERYA